jgi:hypothetical protein
MGNLALSEVQVFGPPPNFSSYLIDIKPSAYTYLRDGVITQDECDLFVCASSTTNSKEERLECCRTLLKNAPDLPFELERWVTFALIELAASLNLADEFISTTNSWLELYPTQDQYLSQEWLVNHPNEVDANTMLRLEVARIIVDVVNESMNWPFSERLTMFDRLLMPVIEEASEEISPERIYARRFYVRGLESLFAEWCAYEELAIYEEVSSSDYSNTEKTEAYQVAREAYEPRRAKLQAWVGRRQLEETEALLNLLEQARTTDIGTFASAAGLGLDQVSRLQKLTEAQLSAAKRTIAEAKERLTASKNREGQETESAVSNVFRELQGE